MGNLDGLKQEALHTRAISTTTYRVDDARILVEGTLRDERQVETYSLTQGERVAPGVVHDLTLRLLIQGGSLTIEELEVEMAHVPLELCRKSPEGLMKLRGERIAPGFSNRIRESFGGPHGCAHLNALLLSMASAAVQGFWSLMATRPLTPAEGAGAMDPAYLVDTCWVWRRGGELYEELCTRLGHAPGEWAS